MGDGGQVVWITGASSGIGEALAQAFAADGARVVLTARREAELERVRQALPEPDRHHVQVLDMADADALPAAVDAVLAACGQIDVLVNNAGMTQRSLVHETSMETIRRIMEVDYFGVVGLTKAVLPHMLERGSGQLAVVSSLAGKFGTPLRSAYASAKHAVIGFFECLRAEVYDQGLRVTVICPGFVKTNVSYAALSGDGSLHGKMDDRVEAGLPADKAAQIILKGMAKEQEEILLGGKELLLARLYRIWPGRVRAMVRKMKVT